MVEVKDIKIQLMPIDEVGDVYVDAFLTDQANNLLFLSLYGRDTPVQAFIAGMTLHDQIGGYDNFNIITDSGRRFVQIRSHEHLDKETGRLAKTIFGELSHMFLFDQIATRPDRSNHRGIVMYRPGANQNDSVETLWAMIKTICHVPLLDHWSGLLIDTFATKGWITDLNGAGMSGKQIDLSSPDVEVTITQLVRGGGLMLRAEDQVNSFAEVMASETIMLNQMQIMH